MPVLPALVTFAVTMWGIGGPSYWRDESVSVVAAHESLANLRSFLRDTDAVHAFYYVLLRPVAALGTGETVTRMPSAIAAALAAGGIAVLGRRLCSAQAGLFGGLIYATLPMVSRYAQEVRQYTLVSAGAVLATWLLVRALEHPRPRLAPYAAYGAVLALLGWLHLYSLLLVAAHGVTVLAWRRRGHVFGWAAAVCGALLTVAPLAAVARGQQAQVAWLRPPGIGAPIDFGLEVAGGRSPLALLALLVVIAAVGVRGRRRHLAVVLPWLLVPFTVALVISQVEPVYHPRYLLHCACALALAAGIGLAHVSEWLPRRAGAVLPFAVIAACAALSLPAQLAIREPGSRPDDLRGLATVLRAEAEPGDAVLYLPASRRIFATAYGDAFEHLDAETLHGPGGLTDLPTDRLRTALAAERRVWVVGIPPPGGRYRTPTPGRNLAALRSDRRFDRAGAWDFGGVHLELFSAAGARRGGG
ncbi:glycosyltransferase family 39 protein [Actinomadura sp. HBU206391]|uniref:glycosyltransferase family 39 protein n=1 Tax=Actinomadura sp. HBU206391 TaxID=2731692 RepID=UPI00164F8680|nr:glycosyltransferase family 39 protein [Actinomadura sp. HBU206391]MBC6461699.1 glycosyltransferase family 39 protein [Actinomadura sp. HBU206391]